MADRVILHCDCNAFFASVETLLNPALKGVPMAVAGDPENRHGIILAKNELAKRCGVQTAETIYSARQKCPGLVLVPPHHGRYAEISERINRIYLDYTDLVDPFGIDESFLDLTGSMHLFPMTPHELADTIRARIRQEIGITISVGVSFCRVFAKLGSDYKKPDATTVIDRENYKQIAYPLPVSALLYVGKKTESVLRSMGILTVGDLAGADRSTLVFKLGEAGDMLWRYANGLDEEPVRAYHDRPRPKSVGNGTTFAKDIAGKDAIEAGVMSLVDSVAARLRHEGLKCTVVQVQIKDPDFHTVQRQTTLSHPSWLRREIIDAAMELIRAARGFGAPIRTLTVTASGLVAENDVVEQLDMFAPLGQGGTEKQEAVEGAMSDIRKKFGKKSIKLGCYDQPSPQKEK